MHALPGGELVKSIDIAASLGGTGISLPRWSGDGSWVMLFGEYDDGVVGLFEVDGDRVNVVSTHEAHEAMFGVAFDETSSGALRPSYDGSELFMLLGHGDEQKAAWFDAETGSLTKGPLKVDGVAPVLVLEDGSVIYGGMGVPLTLLNSDLDAKPVTFGDDLDITPYDVSPDGRVLAGGEDGTAVFVDLETGDVEHFAGGGGTYALGAVSPDGSAVALQSLSDGLQFFDTATMSATGGAISLPGSNPASSGMWWDPESSILWTSTLEGVVGLRADPVEWRAIACSVAGRELTSAEWGQYVSESGEPIASCAAHGEA